VADIEQVVEDRVAYITLNRPERKNAFTLDMIDALGGMLADARDDDDVRVVVLTGAGDAFCSGVDLSIFDERENGRSTPLTYKRTLTEHVHRVVLAAEALDKPLIAGVNGVAVGAGMDLALMCDMRLAADTARFAEAYIKAGIVPGAGACWFLPRLVGRAKALELLLTGDFVDAAEAHSLGIVNRVVHTDALADELRTLAAQLAAQSPIAAAMIKRATIQGERTDLRTSLDLISSHMGVVISTDDSREALTAMRERRPAVFTNS
jgi:enoyl-CoA hydratase/carnithine racemase